MTGRPSDWSAVDLATDPVPGAPDDVRTLASSWTDAQQDLTDLARRLTSAHDTATDTAVWKGDVAGRVAGNLEQVQSASSSGATACGSLHDALSTWAGAMESAQQVADQQLALAVAAKATHAGAMSRHSYFSDALARAESFIARYTGGDTLIDVAFHQAQATTARAELIWANHQMAEAEKVILHAKEEIARVTADYKTAGSTAAGDIDEAVASLTKVVSGLTLSVAGTTSTDPALFWTVWEGGSISGNLDGGFWGGLGGRLDGHLGGSASASGDAWAGPDGAGFVGAADAGWGFTGQASGDIHALGGFFDASGTGSVFAGVGAAGEGKGEIDWNHAELSGAASAFAGAKVKGEITTDQFGGLVHGGLSGEAAAGAHADANGGVYVGADGVSAKAGASAFAGAEASAHGELGFSGIQAGVGVSAKAGAGGEAEVGGSFSLDDIGVHAKLGAALGLGAGVDIDIHIQPKQIVDDVMKSWGF